MTERQLLATFLVSWGLIVLYGLLSGRRGKLRNPLKRKEDR